MAKQLNINAIKKPANRKDLLKNELTNGNTTKTPEKKKPTQKKKVGRPKKAKEELLSEKVTMYITKAEEKKLKELSEKDFYNIPIGKVIRQFLIIKNIF